MVVNKRGFGCVAAEDERLAAEDEQVAAEDGGGDAEEERVYAYGRADGCGGWGSGSGGGVSGGEVASSYY